MLASARALPMCFVIYATEAALALIASLPFALELARDAPLGRDPSAQAEWLERLVHLGSAARVSGTSAALVLAPLLLLSPWLQLAWFSSLARGEPLGSSLATGARLWPRACMVSLWVALGLCLTLTPIAAGGFGLWRWLARHPNDRVHDLALLACAAAALPCLALAWIWHDLARARALSEGAFTSARRSLPAALRPALWLRAGLWSGAGWAAVGVAELATWRGPGAAAPLAVALLQAASLARLWLRGAWLADALACADSASASGADEHA
jgi:hypothetical protein